jgi:MFS family permease
MRRKTDSHWRNRSFLAVWSGETVSEIGGSIGSLTNSWLAYQLTGSEAALGSMLMTYFLPSLLVQLAAGPYLDRWNRRLVMICSQWARGAAYLLPLLMLSLGRLEIWHLHLVSLINGLIQPLYVPSSLAFLPAIVPKEQLPSANAAMDGTVRLMMVVGPPVGGLALAAWGAGATIGAVCLAYLASGAFLLVCEDDTADKAVAKESWVRQFTAGMRYFRHQRVLLWLGIFLAFVQFAVGAAMVLNPAYVTDDLHGDSFQYGLFVAGYPCGYALGSLLIGRKREHRRYRWIMLGSLFLGGLTFIALAVIRQIGLAIFTEVLAGVAAPFFHVHSTSLYQRMVPNELLGRVLSVRLLIIRTAMPLGILVSGIWAESWGVRPIYAVIGSVICLTSLVGILLPWFSFLEEGQEKCENFVRM